VQAMAADVAESAKAISIGECERYIEQLTES